MPVAAVPAPGANRPSNLLDVPEVEEAQAAEAEQDTAVRPDLPSPPEHLGRDLTLYSLARFGLVAVVAVVLALVGVPILIGIIVGLVLGLPLSMLALRPLHNRVSAGLAARSAIRRAQRDRLRAELRGEASEASEPFESGDPDAAARPSPQPEPPAASTSPDTEPPTRTTSPDAGE